MKPFLVFAGDERGHPAGGWNDFQGSFPTLSDALIFVAEPPDVLEWFQVVDIRLGKIVKRGERP